MALLAELERLSTEVERLRKLYNVELAEAESRLEKCRTLAVQFNKTVASITKIADHLAERERQRSRADTADWWKGNEPGSL